MKLYVYSISTFVALGLLGSFSKAATLTPARFSSTSTVAATATTKGHQFKSFHEWKTGMISAADTRAKQAQDAIMLKQRTSASADPNAALKTGSEAGVSGQIHEMQNQLEKEQYQLSIAKELTISDYFVGYLTKQKDLTAAINEVSGRLTPEEVAELMSAYANNFFTSVPANSAVNAPARAGSNQ
ncbi:MAG: hypothetical protein H7256_10425 [Bdellovibrio sp.]|nr:hypothetical protein [Bdellovibrio sp.]